MAIATINPTTGETVETFEPHDDAEVQRRIAAAADAAEALRDTSFAQRAEWMNATADIIEADVERAAEMITLEMGKQIEQSRAEVLKCAKNMRFYAKHAEDFLADEPLDVARVAHVLGELRQPVDVVGGQVGHAVAQEKWLDALAHLIQLGALFEAQARDPCARVGDGGDESLRGQDPQGLADRHAARTVLRGEFLLTQPGARRIGAAQYFPAQFVGDPRTGDAVTHLGLRHGPPLAVSGRHCAG